MASRYEVPFYCLCTLIDTYERRSRLSQEFELNHKNIKRDNYHQDSDMIDYATSENPAEHKSFNLIELTNGQYALYPNNRVRIYDNSLTPENPKTPDFKVSTRYYQVENSYERLAMGNEDEYFWKTAQERDSNPEKSSDLTNQEQKNGTTLG